jgi:high-affinity nickel permease
MYRVFVRVRNGAPYVEEDLNLLLADRGLLARLFRTMFAMIKHSLHMYPLGLLFGLGFDTATEIGLLSISATEWLHRFIERRCHVQMAGSSVYVKQPQRAIVARSYQGFDPP